MKIELFTLIAALSIATSLSAKSYYISPDGNDSNAGTLSSPFKTIAKATSVAKAGDVCMLREGTYHETLKSVRSGTKKKPITFTSYKDEKAIIDATESIEGWTKHSGNIYTAHKKLKASQPIYNTLFYQDELLDIARWPNNTDGDKFTFDGHKIENGSAAHFVVKDLPNIDFTNGYFCYLGAHSGTSWSRTIDSSSEEEIHFEGVDTKKWPYNPHNPTVFRNKNRGQLYIYGKLELLDHENEWYYDAEKQVIYAIFPNGEAPKAGSVKAGVRAKTAEITHDYITIDGLTLFGGEAHIKGSYCTVSNSILKNCSQTLDGLIGISAQSNTGSLHLSGGNITVENNLIEGGQASGVVIAPAKEMERYTIHNNVIRYFNTIGIHANAIRSRGNKTTITNNTIYTCGRDGVYTSGKSCEIAYNDIYDCMRINNDGGVFYTVGNKELKNSSIHHNYLHDSYGPAYADGRAAGIYLDNDSKGYEVYKNVIWNVTWSALMINWHNTDINFYHNTIWDCGFNMGRWANGRIIERIQVKNNYANVTSRDKIENKGDKEEWIGTTKEANIIAKESPFVSAKDRDFTIAADSPLVDKGVVIKGYTEKNYVGKGPDVGAYEYGEKPWSVGASWASEVIEKSVIKGTLRGSIKRESEDEIFKNKTK